MVSAAACSSSSKHSGTTPTVGGSSGASSTGGGNGKPIKIGVITSLTGAAASGFTGFEKGVKARLGLANAAGGINGHKIEYVMEDDASTPAGAAAAVRKATQQDHVFALISGSSLFFGGYKVATAAKLPVVGVGIDGGPEWLDTKDNPTLSDIYNGVDFTKVATTYGLAAKAEGVTKLASVGYIESPSSAEAGKSAIASAVHEGIAAGPYIGLHYGSTDVGPAVLAIKNSGADAVYLPTIPNTAFAIMSGLQQAGVKMKMVIVADGYGGDVLGDKSAITSGNGAYFVTSFSPVEANTPATKQLQAALQTYADQTVDPSLDEYEGYSTTDLFLAGLSKAGANPTQGSLVSALHSLTWNGAGLFQSINYSVPQVPIAAAVGPGNCFNLPQLLNGKFVLNPALNPICGSVIPGLKISG